MSLTNGGFGPLSEPVPWGRDAQDDIDWEKGKVTCPKRMTGTSTSEVPSWCPYSVEHFLEASE